MEYFWEMWTKMISCAYTLSATTLPLSCMCKLEELSKFLEYPSNMLEKPSQLIWNISVPYWNFPVDWKMTLLFFGMLMTFKKILKLVKWHRRSLVYSFQNVWKLLTRKSFFGLLEVSSKLLKYSILLEYSRNLLNSSSLHILLVPVPISTPATAADIVAMYTVLLLYA